MALSILSLMILVSKFIEFVVEVAEPAAKVVSAVISPFQHLVQAPDRAPGTGEASGTPGEQTKTASLRFPRVARCGLKVAQNLPRAISPAGSDDSTTGMARGAAKV